jgi:hypothetical protein
MLLFGDIDFRAFLEELVGGNVNYSRTCLRLFTVFLVQGRLELDFDNALPLAEDKRAPF